MKGTSYLLLSQICFVLIGVFTKYIGSALDSLSIVFFRVFIATVFIAVFAIFTKSIKDLSINRHDIVSFAIIGFLVCMNFVFFIAAFSYTSIMEVALLSSITPVFVCIIASYFLKENITINIKSALVLTLVGVCIMNFNGFESTHFLGNIFVIISAFFAAGQIVYIRLEDRDHTALDTAFWPMAFASIFLSPLMIGFDFGAVLPSIYGWLFLLGVVSTGVAYIFFAEALKYIEASRYSILSTLLFPLFSLFFGVLLFGERLTSTMIYGGVFLVVSGVLADHDKSVFDMVVVKQINHKFLGILRFVRRV